MNSLRLFIAADIPSPIQQAIQRQINILRKSIGDSIRWVSVQNIHVTLKFLGDVPSANVDPLTKSLSTEADSHKTFDISIQGLGSFPNSKLARVLYIGIQAPAELEALQQGIELSCERLGYKSDSRPFSPHLTIGRVREGASPRDREKIRKALEETTIDSLGVARVDSVHLYKSELKPGGSVYTKLFSVPLKTR